MAHRRSADKNPTDADEIANAIRNGKLPAIPDADVHPDGLQLFAEAHERLNEKLRVAAQDYLLRLEGTTFNDGNAMRRFAEQLMSMLDTIGGKHGLAVRVQTGAKSGQAGRLVVVESGAKKEVRFAIRLRQGVTILHANGMRVPRLELCPADPDLRKQQAR